MLCSGHPGLRYQGCSGLAPGNADRRKSFFIHGFVDICELRKLELLDLSGLAHITAHQAAALEHAIRARQKLGLLQPIVNLCLPKRPTDNGTCIHLLIDSSHQQVFSRTEPGEQLGVFVERYWRQKRVKAWCKADAAVLHDCQTCQGSFQICCQDTKGDVRHSNLGGSIETPFFCIFNILAENSIVIQHTFSRRLHSATIGATNVF